MAEFGFSFVSGEGYLRRFLLPWLQASGGMMSHEEIELRVVDESRRHFGACLLDARIDPNHVALNESRTDTYWGGGLYFNLEIASPAREEITVFLEKVLAGKNRKMGDITRAFMCDFDMLPAVIIMDPAPDPQPDFTRPEKVLRKIETLRAVMVLSHRVSHSVSHNLIADPHMLRGTRHAHLIHVGAHSPVPAS